MRLNNMAMFFGVWKNGDAVGSCLQIGKLPFQSKCALLINVSDGTIYKLIHLQIMSPF